jgi:predicted CxxxxCH...CXXCH cytochrome family protein
MPRMKAGWIAPFVAAAAAAAAAAAVAASLAGCGFESPAVIPPPNAEPRLGCAIECHGDDVSNAPPKSVSGAMETTAVAVGAHRSHLDVAPTWHRKVACEDCHVVPAEVDSPGHLDGDGKAEVVFSMVAGPGAAWNGTTCTTRCHGSAAVGGAQPAPMWTRVDGSQSTCGSCHGHPPPPPHPADTACAKCHPTMEENHTTFRDPESHINGTVEWTEPGATGGCTSCHGSPDGAAPPKDLAGKTAPTDRGVGAHARHLAPSTWHRQIACSACHVVPLTRDAPGHLGPDNLAEVVFTPLNRRAVYTAATATCTNLYCHGNGRDNNGRAIWTAPGALGCDACHSMNGTNMSGAHREHLQRGVRCSQCHATVVDANRNILNANLHVNGAHEVKMAAGTYDAQRRRCQNSGCHGTKEWNGGGDDGGDD